MYTHSSSEVTWKFPRMAFWQLMSVARICVSVCHSRVFLHATSPKDWRCILTFTKTYLKNTINLFNRPHITSVIDCNLSSTFLRYKHLSQVVRQIRWLKVVYTRFLYRSGQKHARLEAKKGEISSDDTPEQIYSVNNRNNQTPTYLLRVFTRATLC